MKPSYRLMFTVDSESELSSNELHASAAVEIAWNDQLLLCDEKHNQYFQELRNP